MTFITFNLKGYDDEMVSEIIASLNIEFGDNVSCTKTTDRSFGIIESLIVAITGNVTGYFVRKLIEKLLTYKDKKPQNFKLIIIDDVHNVSFSLPEQKVECNDHFRRIEVTGPYNG